MEGEVRRRRMNGERPWNKTRASWEKRKKEKKGDVDDDNVNVDQGGLEGVARDLITRSV